jgi:hypothetical protein
MNNKKMRVWWIPQVGAKATFYVPVESVEEAKKFMDMLAAYDCFQYNHKIKPDFCNTGGLQIWDESENDWVDWTYEDDESYYDDVDEYCEEKSEKSGELSEFTKAVMSQVSFD